MFGLYLLLSLTCISAVPALQAVPQKQVLENRIKGAILGASIGDALGRATDVLETTHELKNIYGADGLSSFKEFKDRDWAVDSAHNKIAPYTENTALATLVLEIGSDVRKSQKSKEVLADRIARRMVDALGQHKLLIDPYFELRNYSPQNKERGEMLSILFDRRDRTPWWFRGPEEVMSNQLDMTFHEEYVSESDSGSLMRAWPLGLIFADNDSVLKDMVDYQTIITHRHPTARAASVALAVGIAASLQGIPVDDVVHLMVRAAEKFDRSERLYKRQARKLRAKKSFTKDVIVANQMFTSDMIRYAALKAHEGLLPEQVFGDNCKRQDNNRSFRGYLLGFEADEAVAAAVYIMVRHADDIRGALIEAANMPGRSALVASLAGALVGARVGIHPIKNSFAYELERLENSSTQRLSADELSALLHSTYQAEVMQDATRPAARAEISERSSSWWKWGLGIAAVAVAGYFAWKKLIKPWWEGYQLQQQTQQKVTAVTAASAVVTNP